MTPSIEPIIESINIPQPRELVTSAVNTLVTITHNGIMYVIDSVLQQMIDYIMGMTSVITVNLEAITSIPKGLANSMIAQLNGIINNLENLVDVFTSMLSTQIFAIEAFIAGINIPEPFRTALITNMKILRTALVNYITPIISTLKPAIAGLKPTLLASSGSLPGPVPVPIPIPPGFSGVLTATLHPILRALVENTLNVFADYASSQIDELLNPIFQSLLKLTNK
jgi:hypothetical protein